MEYILRRYGWRVKQRDKDNNALKNEEWRMKRWHGYVMVPLLPQTHAFPITLIIIIILNLIPFKHVMLTTKYSTPQTCTTLTPTKPNQLTSFHSSTPFISLSHSLGQDTYQTILCINFIHLIIKKNTSHFSFSWWRIVLILK